MSDLPAKLFGATQEQLANRTGMSIRFLEAWQFWWVAVFLLGLLVYWCYRRETGTASRRAKVLLAALRICCLLIVLLLIFHPVLVIERSYLKDSWLLMLLDESMSMTIKDNYDDRELIEGLAETTRLPPGEITSTPRARLVNAAMENSKLNLLERLSDVCKVRRYNFSGRITPLPLRPEDDQPFIDPKGHSTAIGDAVSQAQADMRGQRIAGMIVITDGRSTAGRNVIDAVETAAVHRERPYTVFTVGVGDPAAAQDFFVRRIFGDEVLFANDYATFNVVVSHTGCAGRTAWLRLYRDDTEVTAKSITLRESAQQTVKMKFKPTIPGKYKYTVRAEPLQGELTTENNTSPPHLAEIIDKRMKVLLIAGVPSWEYRYLKNALVRDKSAEVSCLLQSADDNFYQEGNIPINGFPDGREELFEYDVIILQDPDPTGFSDTHVNDIVAFVEDLGGGLIFSAGDAYGPSGFRGTAIEKCLPVVLGRALAEDPLRPKQILVNSFQPRLTAQGLEHPAARFTTDPADNLRLWENLPGFFWYYPVKRLKPAAVPLIEHPTEGNQHGKFPLAAAQFYGRGRVLFIGLDSTWRWRFQQGDRYFYKFWGQAIRSVSSGKLLGDSKRASITAAGADYTVGDTVTLHARCLDRFFRPVNADEIEATVRVGTGEERRVELVAVAGSPGMFHGSFAAAAPGTYTAHFQSPDDPSITAASQPFSVRLPQKEFEMPSMNAKLLGEIAERTGGEYFTLDQIGELPDSINAIREEITEETTLELIGARKLLWAVLGLFGALIATEWWLRKRRMLM